MTSVSDNTIQQRTLNAAMFDYRLFCTHPEENVAFSVDEQFRFIKINLKDGKMQKCETERRKVIASNPDQSQRWCDIRALVRNSKTFIIALIWEVPSGKYFLVTFSLSDGEYVVNDEHYTGITKNYRQASFLTTDEKGQIYFVSYIHQKAIKLTQLDGVKIDVDNIGKITSVIESKNFTLSGLWDAPFIQKGVIYWIEYSDRALQRERILTFELFSKTVAETKAVIDVENWECGRKKMSWSYSTMIGDQVFYRVNNGKQLVFVVYLDLKSNCWKQYRVTMKEEQHVMIKGYELWQSIDGRLFLIGKCSLKSCAGKLHMYFYHVRYVIFTIF